MVIFSGNHLHSTLFNQSDTPRISIDFRICSALDHRKSTLELPIGPKNVDYDGIGCTLADFFIKSKEYLPCQCLAERLAFNERESQPSILDFTKDKNQNNHRAQRGIKVASRASSRATCMSRVSVHRSSVSALKSGHQVSRINGMSSRSFSMEGGLKHNLNRNTQSRSALLPTSGFSTCLQSSNIARSRPVRLLQVSEGAGLAHSQINNHSMMPKFIHRLKKNNNLINNNNNNNNNLLKRSSSLKANSQTLKITSNFSQRFLQNGFYRPYSTSHKTGNFFLLADIGEGIAEVEILKWHVQAGSHVEEFQPLCDVQSDKASTEITSPVQGVIKELCYKEGETAAVGTPLIEWEGDGGNAHASPAAAGSTQKTAPTMTVVMDSTSIKAAPIARDKILATPATRHLAREHNLDLAMIEGTGPQGRIVKGDVLNFIENGGKVAKVMVPNQTVLAAAATKTGEQGATVTPPPRAAPAPQVATILLEDRVEPLSGYAKAMAKTMTLANQVPHFGYCEEIRVDSLIQARALLKPLAEKRGIKLTYMPILLKMTSMALLQYPRLNAHFDAEKNQLIYRAAHNIGVAVDTPNGLIVPNIKNCQAKSIFEIAQDLNFLLEKARTSGISKEHLVGGTFSLSNIGAIGGTYASPVLVVPEVAIGALGRFQKVPRFDDHNNVVPANIMNISWSADHRCIDGATMANFSNVWKDMIENPMSLILDSR